MTTPIFNAIMCDLSIYLNKDFEGEKFAVMLDNASMHKLVVELPFDNIQLVYLPPNTTGYLQVNMILISLGIYQKTSCDLNESGLRIFLLFILVSAWYHRKVEFRDFFELRSQ